MCPAGSLVWASDPAGLTYFFKKIKIKRWYYKNSKQQQHHRKRDDIINTTIVLRSIMTTGFASNDWCWAMTLQVMKEKNPRKAMTDPLSMLGFINIELSPSLPWLDHDCLENRAASKVPYAVYSSYHFVVGRYYLF